MLNGYKSNDKLLIIQGIYSARLKIKWKELRATWALFSSSSVMCSHCVYLMFPVDFPLDVCMTLVLGIYGIASTPVSRRRIIQPRLAVKHTFSKAKVNATRVIVIDLASFAQFSRSQLGIQNVFICSIVSHVFTYIPAYILFYNTNL